MSFIRYLSWYSSGSYHAIYQLNLDEGIYHAIYQAFTMSFIRYLSWYLSCYLSCYLPPIYHDIYHAIYQAVIRLFTRLFSVYVNARPRLKANRRVLRMWLIEARKGQTQRTYFQIQHTIHISWHVLMIFANFSLNIF